MPACIIASAEDISRNAAALEESGLRIVIRPSAPAMARQVKAIGDTSWWLGAAFSPSSRVRRTLRQWDTAQLRWQAVGHHADLDGPALYQWREHGVPIHYLVSADVRARVRDPAAAKWFLAPENRAYLAYEPPGHRLLVPVAIGLPRIWRRICTLASGLLPAREGRLFVYEDIPMDLARAIAVRLNQTRERGLL